jgi:hypothetical protein
MNARSRDAGGLVYAGVILYVAGCVELMVWLIGVAIWASVTNSWGGQLQDGPIIFLAGLAIWMYSLALGGAWWLLGLWATR